MERGDHGHVLRIPLVPAHRTHHLNRHAAALLPTGRSWIGGSARRRAPAPPSMAHAFDLAGRCSRVTGLVSDLAAPWSSAGWMQPGCSRCPKLKGWRLGSSIIILGAVRLAGGMFDDAQQRDKRTRSRMANLSGTTEQQQQQQQQPGPVVCSSALGFRCPGVRHAAILSRCSSSKVAPFAVVTGSAPAACVRPETFLFP